MDLNVQFNRLMIKPANRAGIKPVISKPGTTPETILRRKALMRNVKSPKVTILMGRVRRSKIGLKKRFNTPNMALAASAEARL